MNFTLHITFILFKNLRIVYIYLSGKIFHTKNNYRIIIQKYYKYVNHYTYYQYIAYWGKGNL